MNINAKNMHFKTLNEEIKASKDKKVIIDNCIGQRFIASGLKGKELEIKGTPGNALGSYLDGCTIRVLGNAQDAVGDTMNEGTMYIHGNCGDAPGYSMRGGKIFIKGNAGYRVGIHMKAYKEKLPVLVIGGVAGSFLGEYQAGGVIIVLGLDSERTPVGNFCGTGMHGGKIFIRGEKLPADLPAQVIAKKADEADLAEIKDYLEEFCMEFKKDMKDILKDGFYILTPNTKNPYKQLYTQN